MKKGNPIYASLESMGFYTAGQVCMGLWKGYAVQLRPYNGRYYFLDVAVRVNKGDKSLAKNIRKSVKEVYGKNFACTNSGKFLSFTVTFNKKSPYDEQFTAYMQAIASALQQNGISTADSCAVCGGGSPDSLCFYDSSFQPVHSACIRSSLEQARQDIEQNKVNGSYITGFVGAFLGMLVGSAANILSIVLAERIYALLFALVPLAAAWGYRKFNGKMNMISVVMILLLSFVSIFIMQYVTVVVYLVDEYGLAVGEAIWASSDLLLTGEGLMAIVTGSGDLFLFMLLGIFIAWRSIIQTNTGSLKNLESLRATLRPNPAYSPDGYTDSCQASESTVE